MIENGQPVIENSKARAPRHPSSLIKKTAKPGRRACQAPGRDQLTNTLYATKRLIGRSSTKKKCSGHRADAYQIIKADNGDAWQAYATRNRRRRKFRRSIAQDEEDRYDYLGE